MKNKIKRMFMFKYILSVSLTLILCGCVKNVALSDSTPTYVPADFERLVEIKNWLAIGPFEFDTLAVSQKESFLINDLFKYGITEGVIDKKALEMLQRNGFNSFLINLSTPHIKLMKYVSDDVKSLSNFYLVSQIYSDVTQDVTLVLDGTHSYSAWLNGEKLIELRGKYNTIKVGDKFVNVTLKQGVNIFFVKINRGTNVYSWDFISYIAPRLEAEKIYLSNYLGDIVVNPIFNDSIEIYAGPYTNGSIELSDINSGQILARDSFSSQNTKVISGFQELNDSFYKVSLTVGGERLEEIVYKGDLKALIEQMKERVARMKIDDRYADDFTAAIERVDYVDEMDIDTIFVNSINYVNRNNVFWGYSLQSMLKENASIQFMTYKDKDYDVREFIFLKGNSQNKINPLVIIVPYALTEESMIKDTYSGNLNQIEAEIALAKKYGFALVWIYACGKNYSAYKTEKEITAIINRLKIENVIDTQKIYITGTCEGGRRALLQVAASPGRYAAGAFADPITLSGGIDGVPLNLLPQMNKIPILLKHGINDEVSSVEHSRRFFVEAQKYDIPIEYIETDESHTHIYRDYYDFAFEFFSKIRR